jgi:predicted enzyme related to lactoylglutathione lyase
MVKEIAFVAYPSKSIQSTREWYENMLGLKFGPPFKEEGIEQYAEAQVGSGYFSLMNSDWIEREPGTGVGVAFEVDDIDKTIAELRSKGVKAEDAYATPVCKVTSFNDPEGNRVTLHQVTVPH